MSPRPLTALTARPKPDAPDDYLAGWDGHPVEAWRLMARDLYRHQLVDVVGRSLLNGEDTTFADWVGAYVRLERRQADRNDVTRFWVDEVALDAMPRHWLRWAVDMMQARHKVTRGNPADAQHCSYLVECDLFLSADARYISILRDVRDDAPVTVAEPVLVSGDRSVPVVERIGSALSGHGRVRLDQRRPTRAWTAARSPGSTTSG